VKCGPPFTQSNNNYEYGGRGGWGAKIKIEKEGNQRRRNRCFQLVGTTNEEERQPIVTHIYLELVGEVYSRSLEIM